VLHSFTSRTSRSITYRERRIWCSSILQHPIEVNGVLGARSKGAYPSDVVLPGSLGLGALGIMFHVDPPNGKLGSQQPILPCSNGAFPTVQVPLTSEELLPQLVCHRRCCHCTWRRRRSTPINKRGSAP
jgi:hypothetical protein